MAVFPSFKLTKKGEELLNRSIGEGKVLTFTKFEIGDGNPPSDFREQTSLVNKFYQFPVLSTDIQKNQILRIKGYFDNKSFTGDKQLKEIGVFVKIENDETEYLYSYTNAGESGDIIPGNTRGFYSRTLDVANYIGYATNITFNIEQLRDKYAFNTENEMKVASYLKAGDKVELWGNLVLGDKPTDEYIIQESGEIRLNNGLFAKKVSFKYIAQTIEEMKKLALKVGDVVEVLGYYESGDGAGHKRIIANEDDDSGVQLSNKLWANILHNGEVNVSWFGAKGDGVTDDTLAIQKAINVGTTVYFDNKTYLINSNISSSKVSNIYGNNTLFKIISDIEGSLLTFSNKKINIASFKFDIENKSIDNAIVVTNSKQCVINDIEIFNIKNKKNGLHCIDIINPFNCDISNLYIHDCAAIGNKVITDGPGNATGILVSRFKGNCTIHDSYFEEIHTIDNDGDIIFEDSNAIYVTELNSPSSSCSIYSCSGKDVGKRFIKTQCTCTVSIDNCNYINTKDDFEVGIGIQSSESPEQIKKGFGIISNCTLINNNPNKPSSAKQYLIATSEEITVSNCNLNSGYDYAFAITGSAIINNCNINGYGFIIGRNKNFFIDIKDCIYKGMSAFYVSRDSNGCMNMNNSSFYEDKTYKGGIPYGTTIDKNSTVSLDISNCKFYNIRLSLSESIFNIKNCFFEAKDREYYILSTETINEYSYIHDCYFEYKNDVARELPYIKIENHKLSLRNLHFNRENTSSYDFSCNNCTLEVLDGVSLSKANFPLSTLKTIIPYWENAEPSNKSFYQDGYKYLNIQDNKLYKFDKASYSFKDVATLSNPVQSINALYHSEKMKQEGVYDDFITYMDEKNLYDKQQRNEEPQPSENLKRFMQKYL